MTTTIAPRTRPTVEHACRQTTLELVRAAADEKKPGICGTLSGIALVYNEKDYYDTVFAPGCLTRTTAEQVDKGKVKLFLDHGPFVDTHVGTVRKITDVAGSAVMVADIFDTESGRATKEYLEAVLASQGETGLSVGFRAVEKEWTKDEAGNLDTLVFKEIALREISITPVPAVPGTAVTSVRHENGDGDPALLLRTLRSILRSLPESEARAEYDAAYAPSTAAAALSAAPSPEAIASAAAAAADAERSRPATADERLAVLRSSIDVELP